MRAISCGVRLGKGASARGAAAGHGAPPLVLFPVAGSTPISVSHRPKLTKPVAGPTRLFDRVFSADVMWGDVVAIRRRHRDIAASLRLRFSPLEVFPQRQFQPILPRILFRRRSGSALAFMF